MFARNQQALLDLDRQSEQYALPFPQDDLKPQKLEAWAPQMPVDTPRLLRDFYAGSGWSEYLQRSSKGSEDILVVSPYSKHYLSASPAFWQGKQYQLVFGDGYSAGTNHFTELKIDVVAQPVHRFIKYGAIHMLLDPLPQVSMLDDMRMTGSQFQGIVDKILISIARVHAQGFHWGGISASPSSGYESEFYCYTTPQGLQLLLLPTRTSTRCPMGHELQVEEKHDIGEYLREAADNIVTDEIPAPLKEWLASDERKWPISPLESLLPPHTPHYEQSESDTLGQWMEYIVTRGDSGWDYVGGEFEDVLGFIELAQALASKNLLPNFPEEPSPRSLETLPIVFRQNLEVFGSLRTHPGVFMTRRDAREYIEGLADDEQGESDPYLYQYAYDMSAKEGIRRDSGRELPNYPYHLTGDVHGPEYEWRPLVRSLQGLLPGDPRFKRLWSEERWQTEETAATTPLVTESLSIHGVEFSGEMARIFYNTPLATAIEYGTKTYNPPWLSAEDTLLIQDLLEGRIMPAIFYRELSTTAFNVLLAPGSFLDVYEYLPFRHLLDEAFVLGVPFVEQLANLPAMEMPRVKTFVAQIIM